MDVEAVEDPAVLLCHHTISGTAVDRPARHRFADRVAAAAAAGVDEIGLTVLDYRALRAGSTSPGELRAVADDSGVRVAEVEFLNGWWADGERLAADRAAEEDLYEMAEVFGARHLAVGASVPRDTAPEWGR